MLGLDLSGYPLDKRVTADMLPDSSQAVRSRTHAELLRRYIIKNQPTVKEILDRPEIVGSAHWVSVGTVEDVLNDIIERFEAGAIDGFIALPGGSEQSMELFLRSWYRSWLKETYSGANIRVALSVSI